VATRDDDSTAGEPEEAAIWRALLRVRDDLLRRIRDGARAEEIAEQEAAKARLLAASDVIWVGAAAKRPATPETVLGQAENVRAWTIEHVRKDAAEARARLRQFDVSVRQRAGKKLTVPSSARELLEELRRPQLENAAREVLRYLEDRTDTNARFAASALDGLSGTSIPLATRIDAARRWVLEGGRSEANVLLADAITNAAAGIGLDTHILRPKPRRREKPARPKRRSHTEPTSSVRRRAASR
jgi:hypothetical protein